MDDLRVTQTSPPNPAAPVQRGEGRQAEAPATAGRAPGLARSAPAAGDVLVLGQRLAVGRERLLPLAVLQSPRLLAAEWAWRTLLVEHWAADASDPPSAQQVWTAPPREREVQTAVSSGQAVQAAVPGEQAAQDAPARADLQAVVQTWWRLLEALAKQAAQGRQGLGPVSPGMGETPPGSGDAGASHADRLIPFQDIRDLEKWAELPPDLQGTVLLDRLEASVASPLAPVTGGGLYREVRQDGSPPTIRWRAERRTQTDSAGHLVHRLQLAFSLAGADYEVVLLAQRPRLSVHIRCSDAQVSERLAARADNLKHGLSRLGWQVERVTAAHHTDGD
ncbi:hypothetical protein [Alicyclobacillus kakegawensis]|uniref:hypothetical protein n=1 Tax=Alicyclobacillus kakegawensis TaxID=392012 RepID=UPI0008300A42|nr:hypothetical protein [Alicyclobacillus kakegawensis]